jgi:PilZ domain
VPFPSKALAIPVVSPHPQVVIPSHSMSPSKSERRSQERVPARVGVSIQSPESQPDTGYTRDLSESGIFLYANSEMKVGSELEMVLMLPAQLTDGEKRWVCCQASVLRVEPGAADGRFGVAASIRNIATLPEIPG